MWVLPSSAQMTISPKEKCGLAGCHLSSWEGKTWRVPDYWTLQSADSIRPRESSPDSTENSKQTKNPFLGRDD